MAADVVEGAGPVGSDLVSGHREADVAWLRARARDRGRGRVRVRVRGRDRVRVRVRPGERCPGR